MRKLLLVAAIVAAGTIGVAVPAHAFPAGLAPTVTCEEVSIDPAPAASLEVTFAGEINGVAFSRTVTYGAPTPHIATVSIVDLTTATGPLHITATATGNIILGTSETADVTLTCHEPPATSTTAAATSTVPPTTVPPPELPRTGADVGWTALGGAACIVAGAALTLRRRRTRVDVRA